MEKLNFRSIRQITTPIYSCDVPLYMMPEKIAEEQADLNLQLCPDFQRGHVWTHEQQCRFMEFMCMGGRSGLNIYFNHPGWMKDWKGEFVCVDGLQRITAILEFYKDNVPVFGYVHSQIENFPKLDLNIRWNVNNLKTKAEVLQWYLDFNSGGTPHSTQEIERVRLMLEQEKK